MICIDEIELMDRLPRTTILTKPHKGVFTFQIIKFLRDSMMKKLSLASASLAVALAFSQPLLALDYQKAISPETQKSVDVATGFYQDALVYRNLYNIKRYIGETYIQHAPFYGDGTDQLKKALEKELSENPDVDVRIHRTIAEDDYVAIHSTWDYGKKKYVYVDIWRVEGGKLVEHWDHSQLVPEKAENDNTMYLGPEVNNYSDQDQTRNTERSVAVLKTFDTLSDLSAIEKYVADDYIQHNPEGADGKEAFFGLMKYLRDDEKLKGKTTIAKTISMGDMVLVHSKQVDLNKKNDRGTGYIDIFRFNDEGLIAEHWDITERVPEKSMNTNGIFTYSTK